MRVSANDDNTDFYTVPLTKQALRPGTVYADPYGHVLMLVHLVPEANGTPGVFLAVDAEPDGSITRKRFWRGNFLFVHEASLGSPGFKHFRPIVRDKGGALRRLSNAEIGKNPSYGDFSLEQSQMSAEDFYDRMDDVMSPEPLDPVKAMTDAITSLNEQVKTRVTSVENGRKYQEKTSGDTAMPDGASIFETTGAWEDYSTPARDFRLLIAIDVVRGYPDHVARRSDRYAIPPGKSAADVKSELQGVLASELASANSPIPAATVRNGRCRSRMWSTGRRISRWPITRTTASNCAGERPITARSPRPASATRRRRNAPRCRTTAPGSANGTGRRTPRSFGPDWIGTDQDRFISYP